MWETPKDFGPQNVESKVVAQGRNRFPQRSKVYSSDHSRGRRVGNRTRTPGDVSLRGESEEETRTGVSERVGTKKDF